MKITVGILSGGQNKRMGKNKALLKYKGQTFIERSIEEMQAFDEIIISVDKLDKYNFLNHKIVEDRLKGIGPVAGIHEVLKASSNEWVFICGVDMPFVNQKVVEYLALFASEDKDAIVLREQKRAHPLCAIYNRRIIPLIEKNIEKGKYKVFDILNNVNTKYVPIELSCLDSKILKNINTPEEYKEIYKTPIICFCGIKNSGKTTYIRSLIGELNFLGINVGVLKHDGHDFDIDHKGTDSWLFREAGAREVAIFSETQQAFMSYNVPTSEKEVLKQFKNVDLIIIEGLKNSSYKKFELIRKDKNEGITSNKENLLGIISDDEDLSFKEYEVYDYYGHKKMALYLQKYIEEYNSH